MLNDQYTINVDLTQSATGFQAQSATLNVTNAVTTTGFLAGPQGPAGPKGDTGPSASTLISQATRTSSFTAAPNTYNPVDSTSGNITVTLPTSSSGQEIAIKKTDSSSNIVTLSGTINGVASTSLPLRLQNQGKVLIPDGSGGWNVYAGDINLAALDTRYILTETAVKTAAYTAVVGDLVIANATSGAFTVTLPITPLNKSIIEVKKIDSSTNIVTVALSGSDTFTIGGTTLALTFLGHAVTFQYNATTAKWTAINNDVPVASLDGRYAFITSPTFTGTPAAPTATAGTNTTQLATTAFVSTAIANAANTYDDVKDYANLAAFPATGTVDVLYIANDTNFVYRWGGSSYVQVGGGNPNDATPTVKGISRLLRYNIRNYGAVLDGTTDDSAAIQAAISAAAGNGIIYFPDIAVVASTITVPESKGLIFEGNGWQSGVKVKNSTNIYAFTFAPGSSGVWTTFRNMKIDGNAINQSTAGGGIYAKGSLESVFDNVWFTNCFNECIKFDNISNGNYGHHNKVDHCLFDSGNSSPGSGQGIVFIQNDENRVINSEFQFMGGASGSIAGSGYTSAVLDLCGLQTISNTTFVYGKEGVRIQDASRTILQGCIFDLVNGDNAVLKGTDNIVNGCQFYQIGDGSPGASSGIFIDYYGQNIISNNVIRSDTTNGTTRSLIREAGQTGSGVAGANVISGNRFDVQGTLANSIIEQSNTNIVTGNSPSNLNAYQSQLHSFGVALSRMSSFTAVTNNKYVADSTTGPITVTLPATAVLGDTLFIQKLDTTTNVVTLSGNINGTAATSLPLRTQLQGKLLQWDGVSTWNVIAGDLNLAALDARYAALGSGISKSYVIAMSTALS